MTCRRTSAAPREAAVLPALLESSTVFRFGDYDVKNIDLIILISAVVMMIILDQFVRRSRLGRGIRASAQDPEAAALMGVNRDAVVRMTFLLGGLMAGAAAMLYLLKIGDTKYNAGFLLGIKAFTAAVLGGIGNLRGALLGGFVLGLAENYGSALIGSQWKDVVAFLLLVVILLFPADPACSASRWGGPAHERRRHDRTHRRRRPRQPDPGAAADREDPVGRRRGAVRLPAADHQPARC
jgi:branched-subunit amino acid ABC-type transport system permease component